MNTVPSEEENGEVTPAVWTTVDWFGPMYEAPENPPEGAAYIDRTISETENYIRFYNNGAWSEAFLWEAAPDV